MKCLLVRLALVGVLVVIAKLAAAGGPVGRWAVDEDAMRAQLRSIVETQLGDLTAEQRTLVAPMIDGRIEELLAQLRGTAEFLPDGRAVFVGPEGERESGRWELEGEEIRLRVDGRERPMIGRLADDRMSFADPAPEPDAMPAPELVLRRLQD